MSNSVHEVEVTIEEMEAVIDKLSALERLGNNADFKLIVNEGYFDHEARRLVMLYSDKTPPGDPRITVAEQKTATGEQIEAIGMFRQYLATIQNFGRSARLELDSYKAELSLRIDEDTEENGEVI